jgi:hypothetical protein
MEPAMPLSQAQIDDYRRDGHVTVPGLFSAAQIAEVLADLEAWSAEVVAGLSEDERRWYLEGGGAAGPTLRKLDHPVYERPVFRTLASDAGLLACIEQLIGPDLRVVFSQVFMKPAGGGGPKPVHQDNYYFGPDDRERLVTAWIALDDADEDNGCMRFADGSQHGPILAHTAPADQPFNLQIPAEALRGYAMTAAPVPAGGVSFHHGNVLHGSADNASNRPRRACAIHYVSGETVFATPALPYDDSRIVAIS